MKLPQDWEEAPLGQHFEFQNKSKRKAGEGSDSGKYKFFTSSDIQKKYVDEYDYSGEYLIFGTGGNASIHYCNDKFSTSTDCFVVKVLEGLKTKYAYYFLRANMHLLVAGFKGAGLKHISKDYVKSITIRYPKSPKTQEKIITMLEKAEQIKKYRKEADSLSKNYLKSVFVEMFGDPLRNNKKFDEKPLKEFGKIITGNTPPRAVPEYYGDYIDWIKSDNLNTSYTYITQSSERLSKKGTEVGRTCPKGSVLVTCIAGSLSCIGNAAIADKEVAFNQQINAICPNNEVDSLYLFYLMAICKKKIQDSSTQSMKGMLSKTNFEMIRLIHPPSVLQKKFGKIAYNYEIILNEQRQLGIHSQSLFDSLMQKAFKGELEV